MVELIELLAGPQALFALVITVAIFGLCPGLILRQIVRMYPKDHPRRAEIVAELYQIDLFARPVWVGAQLETALSEGLGLRRRGRKARKQAAYVEWSLKFGENMTPADLLAAAVVLDWPDPKEIVAVVDAEGFHYRAKDGTRQDTIDPRVVRLIAGGKKTKSKFISAAEAIQLSESEYRSAEEVLASWKEECKGFSQWQAVKALLRSKRYRGSVPVDWRPPGFPSGNMTDRARERYGRSLGSPEGNHETSD